MRVPVAYYLLLLYVTVMFKPLVPIVSDAISHTFSEAIHIATVHAIYGSNHLQKELSNTTSDNTDKHQTNRSVEDPVPVHVSSNGSLYGFYFSVTGNDYYSFDLNKINPGFYLKNFPPPKFS